MAKVTDVKDRTPNQDTIKVCERLLNEANAGELRMLQHDVLTNQGFADGDSVLAKAFEVE